MECYHVLEAVLSKKSYKHLLVPPPLHYHISLLPSQDILIYLVFALKSEVINLGSRDHDLACS